MGMLISPSIAIPIVAFSFFGVESIAVTAYEARHSRSLRNPSRSIAYVIVMFYFLCTIGEALTVRWTAPFLPPIYGVSGTNSTTPTRSSNWVVNVALTAGHTNLAGFLNGCFIFSVLYTSNTAIYVSSRTLYGMVGEIPAASRLGRITQCLSIVGSQTGVPAAAILFSIISFLWLPFLQLKSGYSIEDVRRNITLRSIYPNLYALADRNYGGLRRYGLSNCLVCIMFGIHPL
jgi:amino acid transporter